MDVNDRGEVESDARRGRFEAFLEFFPLLVRCSEVPDLTLDRVRKVEVH